jgi:formylglycine-generating enzyme required for sulfatase activity
VAEHTDVFISSTSIDLPEHRKAVSEAVLNLGLYPDGMEHWPVADENPVEFCRQKIEKAELYIGIYAHRYGWRPDGFGGKSITELEYEWATERGIPRLCFVIDPKHPWSPEDMELEALEDLKRFKARVSEQVRGEFTTPENLKAQVIAALVPHAQQQSVDLLGPYLNRLHHDARQSGLLRLLNPRSSDLLQQPGREITVDQVYTPLDTRQQVTRNEEGHIQWDKAQFKRHLARVQEGAEPGDLTPLSAMEAANHYGRLVLLGDPGSGKSTFVGFLELCLTGHHLDPQAKWLNRLRDQGWQHNTMLPIHVTLRDFAQDMGEQSTWGTAQSLFGFITREMEHCGCLQAARTMQHHMLEGRTLLLLDGLDEVPGERRDVVRDTITAFMTAYPACRVLITCRILSYANPEWQIPGTTAVTLANFDRDKISHFIKVWYRAGVARSTISDQLATERITDLGRAVDNRWLQDMAGNPMLLTVMAIVHNHRGALPDEAARLYQQCVEILMLRWRPEQARELREVLGVDENDLYRMLWQIAYDAHQQQADRAGAADIPKHEVMAIVAEEHLGDDYAKAQLFCDYVEERAGLLIGRGGVDTKRRIYAFPHRTFQEYLAGCFIADDVDFVELLDAKSHAGPNWREVVLLSAGERYFNRKDRNAPLQAVQHILFDEPDSAADWQAVALAGEILQLYGVPALEKHKLGKRVLPEARRQLVALINSGALSPVERAAAGETLGWLGDPRPGVGLNENGLPDIAWIAIPGGEITLEGNAGTLEVEPFHIAQYPVTYMQYLAFAKADDGFHNPQWWERLTADDTDRRAPGQQRWPIPNHPAETVSWYDAMAFCRWLSAKLGYEVRLPTEMEWQQSATGGNLVNTYPWGMEYISGYANIDETDRRGFGKKVGPYLLNQTTAVGMYPQGASAQGVLDHSGNVWEWCLNTYDDPQNTAPGGTDTRVLRGGAWSISGGWARCAYRYWNPPSRRSNLWGFRVVCVAPVP